MRWKMGAVTAGLLTLCTVAAGVAGGVATAWAMGPSAPAPSAPAPAPAQPPTQTPADASRAAVPSGNPVSGSQEAIDAGRKLYGMWCVQCHGPKADGVSRFGNYAGDLRVFWRGYREFVTVVKNGRTGKQMPPWKEVLDDTKIAQIGAYLETLALDGANWK